MSNTSQWQIGAPLITLEEANNLVILLEAGIDDEIEQKVVELAKRVQITYGDILKAAEENGLDTADLEANEEARRKAAQEYCGEFFTEVGALTRDVHEAICQFVEDPRLQVIAGVEFPDATERLKYIIQMTDKAATKTLDAVDACSPMAQKLKVSIENLMPMWDRLMHKHIDRVEFVNLCHQIDDMLKQTKADVRVLTGQLNTIVMAQDYQDLTGQMIQKVICLVGEVETKLVNFLVTVGSLPAEHGTQAVKEMVSDAEKKSIQAQGPALDRHRESRSVASSQDEVDDLLASLGF